MTESVQDIDTFLRLQKENLGRDQAFANLVSSYITRSWI
jgi:hypothetical protein